MPKKDQKYFEGVGRRKRSVARARIYSSSSNNKITINGKEAENFFAGKDSSYSLNSPFLATGTEKKFETVIKTSGGGVTGQIDACKMAISRALVKSDGNFYKVLRDLEYLSRDSRKKERKKAGLKKARKAPQWQKR